MLQEGNEEGNARGNVLEFRRVNAEIEGGEPPRLSTGEVNAGYEASFEPQADGEPGGAMRMLEEGPAELAEGLAHRTEPVDEDEVQAAVDAEEGEAGVPIPEEARFTSAENPFEGTSIDPKSVEARMLIAVEGMKAEIQKALEEAGEAIAEGKTEKAAAIAKDLFARMEAAGIKDMPVDVQEMYAGVKINLEAAIKEEDPSAKARLYKFACGAADFIPVIGPAKMLVEAVAGKTLGGEQLEGWKRFLHGTEGLVFLAIDLTGYGAVATKLVKAGKSGLMAAKLITRTAALMRVLKVPRVVYRSVFNAGLFLARHPKLAQLATRGLMGIIKGRKLRLAKEHPGILKTATGMEPQPDDLTPEQVATPSERPGMSLEGEPEAAAA